MRSRALASPARYASSRPFSSSSVRSHRGHPSLEESCRRDTCSSTRVPPSPASSDDRVDEPGHDARDAGVGERRAGERPEPHVQAVRAPPWPRGSRCRPRAPARAGSRPRAAGPRRGRRAARSARRARRARACRRCDSRRRPGTRRRCSPRSPEATDALNDRSKSRRRGRGRPRGARHRGSRAARTRGRAA